jgi:hypothetical protein
MPPCKVPNVRSKKLGVRGPSSCLLERYERGVRPV